MMVGERPTRIRVEHDPYDEDVHWQAIPDRYGNSLKEVVRSMLQMNPRDRPDAESLFHHVIHCMGIWREITDEGRRYTAKGE